MPEDLGRVLDPAVDLVLVHLAELEREAHVLPHVHVGIEGVVLEDHGYVALARGQVVDHLVADEYLAARDVLEPGDHAQGGGLAATRGADEDDELAVGYVQVHLVNGDDVLAENLGYVFQRHFCHDPAPPYVRSGRAPPDASLRPSRLSPRPWPIILHPPEPRCTPGSPSFASSTRPTESRTRSRGIFPDSTAATTASYASACSWGWLGDYQEVGPCLHGADRRPRHGPAPRRPLHGQVIGYHHAVEANLLAKHVNC